MSINLAFTLRVWVFRFYHPPAFITLKRLLNEDNFLKRAA